MVLDQVSLSSYNETIRAGKGGEPFDGIIAGARADEEGSRSKERYFSSRDKDSQWDIADQPPEFWNFYKTEFKPRYTRPDPSAARLDRTEYLGIYQTGKYSDGLALL